MQQAISEIDKNNDQLLVLAEHKQFLFDIFKKENKAWADSVTKKQEEKKKEIRTKWIMEMKQNRSGQHEEEIN